MSDPVYRPKYLVWDLKDIDTPDEVLYLTGTNAAHLSRPPTQYGIEFAIGQLPLAKSFLSWVNSAIDAVDNLIETTAVFPYRFKIEVLEYESKGLDAWNDGVLRAKFGNLSLLSTGSFLEHYAVQHLNQEWLLDSYKNRLAVDTSTGFTYGGSSFLWFLRSFLGLDSYAHSLGVILPTHLAHRLVPAVKLKVSVWWYYRVTVYDIIPTAPI